MRYFATGECIKHYKHEKSVMWHFGHIVPIVAIVNNCSILCGVIMVLSSSIPWWSVTVVYTLCFVIACWVAVVMVVWHCISQLGSWILFGELNWKYIFICC